MEARADHASVTIRRAEPADAEAITRVHVASWQTTYRGLLPDKYLATLDSAERLAMWRGGIPRRDICVYVAEDRATGELIGFTNAGPNRDLSARGTPGELYAIYLLEHAQRRGVGRALFEQAREWLRQHRLTPFVLWVLEGNAKARAFYERQGGMLGASKPLEIGGVNYTEVAYRYD